MKLIKNYLLCIPLLTIFFASCTTTNKGFQSSPVISRNVQLDPIKADLEVNESVKLKGESSATYFLIFRVNGDNTIADGINYSTDASASLIEQLNPLNVIKASRLSKVRGAAAYNALSTGDYDVLVHPNYVVTVQDYLIVKKYKVSVDGYGAKYKNFRTERQKIVVMEDGKEFILQD
jgi:hypothetical protein